jgi:hypothetical protein
MRTAELEEMGEIASNLKIYNLIAQLREGSGFLEDRKETFGSYMGNLSRKVFSFYETEKIKPAKKVDILSL